MERVVRLFGVAGLEAGGFAIAQDSDDEPSTEQPGSLDSSGVFEVPMGTSYREIIERELGSRVEDLGYELVDVRWGGSARRPQLKVRVDRPDSQPGRGVTVQDCASVSRALVIRPLSSSYTVTGATGGS